eukprot:3084051-Alexandrium_andersonii.AAC.1
MQGHSCRLLPLSGGQWDVGSPLGEARRWAAANADSTGTNIGATGWAALGSQLGACLGSGLGPGL